MTRSSDETRTRKGITAQRIFLPHLLLYRQYLSKLTAHLYLTTDFDIISWLLTFTLTTVNHFSFLSILWSGLFLYHIEIARKELGNQDLHEYHSLLQPIFLRIPPIKMQPITRNCSYPFFYFNLGISCIVSTPFMNDN